ncbi:hypothetical protein D3C76_1616900 [compost metagenome]
MAVADFAQPLPVVRRRHDHTAGTLHRFGDQRGNGLRAEQRDLVFQLTNAVSGQFFRIAAVPGVAVQPRRVEQMTASQQRPVVVVIHAVAAHGGAAHVHAMVTIAQ